MTRSLIGLPALGGDSAGQHGTALVSRAAESCRVPVAAAAPAARRRRRSAQALSFVLTLPIFMWVMMFIVQVSQLMIATIAVNYAAFAAARTAIVWIPANIAGVETENCISGLVPTGQAQGGDTYSVNATPGDPKYAKIQMASRTRSHGGIAFPGFGSPCSARG